MQRTPSSIQISTPTSQRNLDPFKPKQMDHTTTSQRTTIISTRPPFSTFQFPFPLTQSPNVTINNDTILPLYNQSLNNNQQGGGISPNTVVPLIAYTTRLLSEVTDLTLEEILQKAGISTLITCILAKASTRTKQRLISSTTSDNMTFSQLPSLERDDSESERSTDTESEISTPTSTSPSPSIQGDHSDTLWTSIPRSHRIKRTLKPCLRLRDVTKTIPLRAPGCKGSRRRDGDETPRTVSWGFQNEGDGGNGELTPLEEVFFVEKCEWDLLGVEMLVVRDERCSDDGESDPEEESDKERGGCLLRMKIERKLSL